MEEKFVYSCCGCEVSEDDIQHVYDEILCPDCVDEQCCTCDCCGDLIWNSDDFGEDGVVLCEDCYNNRLASEVIEDYSYKPEPIFYGNDTNRYYGIELEVDKGGNYSSYAEQILDTANVRNQHIYIKSDGSLDDGFEIVSHPMTLDYHINEMDWESVLQTAKNLGYYSHDTSTCGYHIHISRQSLGDTYDEQEDVISKIMYFIELHWNEMLKFSRRTESNMNRWSARFGYEKTSKEILEKAKQGSHGRYVAVNIQNHSTVEIRMFRVTLKYNTFIATLQMVNKIVDIAINLTDEEINHQSWSDFVSTIKDEELIQYLKERNLYINEPVFIEEEI